MLTSFIHLLQYNFLYKSIQFAKETKPTSEEYHDIIIQSIKTLPFDNQKPWIKRKGDEDFDVIMRCYDGAEVCELVGSHLLNKLLLKN